METNGFNSAEESLGFKVRIRPGEMPELYKRVLAVRERDLTFAKHWRRVRRVYRQSVDSDN